MKTKKNIDRLYRDKFHGAEVPPPDNAWENIAFRLPERKQQKGLVPIWTRYAGAAAVVAIFLLMGARLFAPAPNTTFLSSGVDREDIHKEIRLASSGFTETMLRTSLQLQALMQQQRSSSDEDRETISSENRHHPSYGESKSAGGDSSSLAETGSFKNSLYNYSALSTGIFSNTPFGYKGFLGTEDFSADGQEHLKKTSGSSRFQFESAVAVSEEKDAITPSNENDALQEISVKAPSDIEEALVMELSEEILVFSAESAPGNRMSISTRIAPVFFENLGGGNSFDSRFAENAGSGEVSISYGINLAYQINEKVKLRSGINKLDLSYSTRNVPMAAAMSSPTLNRESIPVVATSSAAGNLQQEMGFIEVPMEMEYRLLDQKIGLNLIAGGSTLFLNNNEVSLNSGMQTTYLGEAHNLRELSFSANVGLGLDYEFTPGFFLNLEPIFKYQLNTFNGTSQVKPYFFGIYSGFSVSF